MADYKNIFQSIRVKLLLSFLIMLIVLLIFSATFVILNFNTIRSYEKIMNNLVLENSFNTLVPQLIDSYAEVIHSDGSESQIAEYNALVSEINSTIAQLDSSMIDKSSRAYYIP
ncbi:MAG TPA: hypothetical protein VEC16_02875, partial [Alphaproteobacteria bacterium]|nr:hypothetical protein [Alphaproteobacteria bacterium]